MPPRFVSLPAASSNSSLPPVIEESRQSTSLSPSPEISSSSKEVSPARHMRAVEATHSNQVSHTSPLEDVNSTLEKEASYAPPKSPFESKEVSPTATMNEFAIPTLASNNRAAKRKSVFGDIPLETFGPADTYVFDHPPQEPGEPLRTPERRVTRLARRIHGWSWQAYPIGMGTSAVYVTMSGLRERSNTLRTVETIFFFLNIVIFLINLTTLALQAIRAFLFRFPGSNLTHSQCTRVRPNGLLRSPPLIFLFPWS
jgi:hypothetical protein